MHPLLGKRVTIEGEPMTIRFLRPECDAGVVDTMDRTVIPPALKGPSVLVRLSDLSIIRKLTSGEDYDKAVLAVKPVAAKA